MSDRSNVLKVVVAVGLVAAAVALFFILRGGDGSDKAAKGGGGAPSGGPAAPAEAGKPGAKGGKGKPKERTKPPAKEGEIRVRGGKPVGGVYQLTYGKGERVRFTVRSDSAEEVHLHGYDMSKDVKAGGTASFDFKADKDGVFDIELEGSHTPIAKLEVVPG
jgi:hypothetical protein